MKESHNRKNTFWVFIVRTVSSIVDLMVLVTLLFCLCFGCYALWDTSLVNEAASSNNYTVYRPSDDDSESFDELQLINSDVLGWLTVYGTEIDYPIVQSDDNEKYLTTNAKGEYEASGSIFLDYHNQSDFSDFNSIIYGHHMAESRMFGDLDKFTEEEFFNTHEYGSLYANGKTYGLTFFAVILTDAYDSTIYVPNVQGIDVQTSYIQYLFDIAKYTRDIDVSINDHIVLLSTCTEEITNGRHILVAKIEDTAQDNPYQVEERNNQGTYNFQTVSLFEQLQRFPILLWAILLLIVLLLILWIYNKIHAARRKHGETTYEKDK